MASESIRCILLDLDGTLADTAPDLVEALNAVRAAIGLHPLAPSEIRGWVSEGTRTMVRAGLNLDGDDAALATLEPRFLDAYAACVGRGTRLFGGMAELLDALDARGLPWGVVTNKPARFTEPLLDTLGLATRTACRVSGDSAERGKPNPDPLLLACRLTGVVPAQTVYVGDAERDIIAAQRAGMWSLVALYGYIDADARPLAWGADGAIESPAELLPWLDWHAVR